MTDIEHLLAVDFMRSTMIAVATGGPKRSSFRVDFIKRIAYPRGSKFIPSWKGLLKILKPLSALTFSGKSWKQEVEMGVEIKLEIWADYI